MVIVLSHLSEFDKLTTRKLGLHNERRGERSEKKGILKIKLDDEINGAEFVKEQYALEALLTRTRNQACLQSTNSYRRAIHNNSMAKIKT